MSKKTAVFNATAALLVILTPWSLARADKPITERVPADAKGAVEISNLAGSVEVSGWDRAEVEVTGKVEDGVERVDVHSSGSRTSVTVVLRPGPTHGGDAHLSIHVPMASAVTATLVSSDFKLLGVRGEVKVQTVSGNISGDVGGDVHASTVSGSVQLIANDARRMEIKTISGDMRVSGGGGEVAIAGTFQDRLRRRDGEADAGAGRADRRRIGQRQRGVRLRQGSQGGIRRAIVQRRDSELFRSRTGEAPLWTWLASVLRQRRPRPRAHRHQERRHQIVRARSEGEKSGQSTGGIYDDGPGQRLLRAVATAAQ
jgi:hypothetical protein